MFQVSEPVLRAWQPPRTSPSPSMPAARRPSRYAPRPGWRSPSGRASRRQRSIRHTRNRTDREVRRHVDPQDPIWRCSAPARADRCWRRSAVKVRLTPVIAVSGARRDRPQRAFSGRWSDDPGDGDGGEKRRGRAAHHATQRSGSISGRRRAGSRCIGGFRRPSRKATTSASSSWCGRVDRRRSMASFSGLPCGTVASWSSPRRHPPPPGSGRSAGSPPLQSLEIAAAVPALVVVVDAGAHELDIGNVADDGIAERHVLLERGDTRRRSAWPACAGCVGDPILPTSWSRPARCGVSSRSSSRPSLPARNVRVARDVLGCRLV